MDALSMCRVEDVMQCAREESARLGHHFIGTKHLLLGIFRVGDNKAVEIMNGLGLDLETLKQSVKDFVSSPRGLRDWGNVPVTPRARQILGAAAAEAGQMNSPTTGAEHLLLALIKDQKSAAAQILAPFGVHYQAVRDAIA